MNMLLNSLVVLATVLGSWMAFPQARRLARTRRVEGVSAVWIGVSLAINGWWLTYGLAAGVWALVPVSAISLVIYASMAAIYIGTVGRSALTPMALGVFGLGMIPLPFLIVGGWSLAAIAVGLSYGIQLLPAVVSACRTRDLMGVSASTWLIAWVEAGLWLVYGFGVGDIALTLAGVVGVAMASIILARLALTGHDPFSALDPRRRLVVTSPV
ncbi:MAG: hypothetical protein E4H05_01920 [Acidimicrobiales bacterium]|nr:MAG: hypothetical protein E4H05_01920 [Acidimicrobiales bacterium]